MTAREIPMSCARVRLLLEAYLEEDLRPVRAARVESHLGQCADCQVELQAARIVRQRLRALPMQTFPSTALAAVLEQIEEDHSTAHAPARRGWLAGLVDGLGRGGTGALRPSLWRPAFATLAVLATAAIIATLARSPVRPGFSSKEVAQAELEARWALAYVSQVTQRSSRGAMQEVLGGVMRDARSTAVQDVLGGVMRDTGNALVHEAFGSVGGPGDKALTQALGQVLSGVIAEQIMTPVADAVMKPLKQERTP